MTRALRVHRIPDAALGNTSYLLEVGRGLAVAVDPRRDVEEHLALADRLGVEVAATIETHLHADFVTGSRELAAVTGAEVVASREARLEFSHRGISGGEEVTFGETTLRVLATPGHTPEHLAYLAMSGGVPVGVFSGGSMIVGGAARTDLIAPESTEALARDQFRSLRALAELPDDTRLWPTHGAGSFCSTGAAADGETTIGAERRDNPLLWVDDEDEFARRMLAGYGSFPPYFLRLREVNRGPELVRDLHEPRPIEPALVASLVDAGAWLVDARPLHEWAVAHPRGAVSIALRPAFASWLGWVVPWDAPVVLLVDPDRLGEARRFALRIGYDRVVGWVDGGIEGWKSAGLPVSATEELAPEAAAELVGSGATLLDVRQASELALGSIPGATHLELGQIVAGKKPESGSVVTMCAHGERAATAASLLERDGIHAANLVGGFEAWKAAGLPVTR